MGAVLCSVFCVLDVVSRVLRGVSWVPIADDCVLGAEYWMLRVECCVLSWGCCVLRAGRWMLCSMCLELREVLLLSSVCLV